MSETGSMRRRRETGRITAMVPLASLAALICVGIAVDFSSRTIAEQEVRDLAAHCARTANQETAIVATAHLQAIDAANQCLAQQGRTGDVFITDDTLTIVIEDTYTTRILSIIGINELPIKGSGSAALAKRR